MRPWILLALFMGCTRETSILDRPTNDSSDAASKIMYCRSRSVATTDRQRCIQGEAWKQVEFLIQQFRANPDLPSNQTDACRYGREALKLAPNPEHEQGVAAVCCGPPHPAPEGCPAK